MAQKAARETGGAVRLFPGPAISLIRQTADRFVENGIPTDAIGLLGGGLKTRLDAAVLVSTWQSLCLRKPLLFAELVLIDEAHSLPKFVRQWMTDEAWKAVPFVGLSATPWTRELGRFFDTKITGQTTENLIELGKLSPFRVYAPSSHLKPDLEGIKTVKGDYAEGELADRMSKPDLIADAVAEWKKRGENRPTLVFAVNRPHAMKLQGQFEKAGVRAGYIDMDVPMDERERIGEQLRSGELQVVVNINCLTTGVDWPFVSCLSLCRPTKKEHTYVQIVGRALRTCKGKFDAIILDHTDTTIRLGLVTEIHFDELDDGTKKDRKKSKKDRKELLPKECLKCGYLKPAGVRKCPDCGWEPKPQSDIEFAAGELLELTDKGRQIVKADKATKQRWFSMLRKIASMRTGMHNKDGWVAHKYRDRFGVWPRGLQETFEWPTEEVSAFVTAADQAYRNSRSAA